MGLAVHEHDRVGRTGWSVAVTGTASMVDDAVVASVLDTRHGPHWVVADVPAEAWMRLRPDAIMGRELLAP